MLDALVIQMLDTRVVDALDQAARRLTDIQPLMERIGAKLEENVNLRFDTKRDPSGNEWAPIKESTRKRYLAKYHGNIPGSLLERSRMMRESLAHNTGADYTEVGFGEAYAGVHETGRKDGKMVRRGLLTADWLTGELGPQDQADVLAEVDAYLLDMLG